MEHPHQIYDKAQTFKANQQEKKCSDLSNISKHCTLRYRNSQLPVIDLTWHIAEIQILGAIWHIKYSIPFFAPHELSCELIHTASLNDTLIINKFYISQFIPGSINNIISTAFLYNIDICPHSVKIYIPYTLKLVQIYHATQDSCYFSIFYNRNYTEKNALIRIQDICTHFCQVSTFFGFFGKIHAVLNTDYSPIL